MPTASRRPDVPKKGARPSEIRQFLDHNILRYDTSHRIERFSTFERARLYYSGSQWLESDYVEDPTRSPYWKTLEMDVDNWMPLPVRNEFVAPLRNEVARLVKAGSQPYVRIEKETPAAAKGAKLAKDVLLDRLDRLRWFEKEYEGCHYMGLYGTWVMKSYHDIDYTKLTRIPVTTACRCPQCGFTSATRELGDKQAHPYKGNPGLQTTQEPNPDDELRPREKHMLTGCPVCPPNMVESTEKAFAEDPMGNPVEVDRAILVPGGPQPLEDFVPTDEEAKSSQDSCGCALGDDIPLVDTGLRNVSVYDWFPENSGLDVEIGEMNEHAESHVETLDWIRAHYKNGDEVNPENAMDMMRWHPVVGGSQHFYGAGEQADPVLFDHHARVKEFHKEPWVEKGKVNKGRSIVMAGDVVLLDGDLLIESRNNPGHFIPRVKYEYIQWEIRDREAWGLSASEWMFSDQDSINTRASQVQYARHVFGNPKIMAPEGCEFTYAGFANTGYSSDIWYYRPGPAGEKPETFGGMQLGSAWVTEENIDLESINRRIGLMDVEIGNAPKDVTAASALMYMGEKASEGRTPRITRIREAKKRIYSHQLELIHEFYREERFYHVRDRNDKWAVKHFLGTDLAGQTNVQLEDEAAYDEKMFRRESLKEGIQLGTIVPDSASAKKKINKALQIPNDINEEQNLQVEQAEDEWIRYFEEEIAPAVSLRLDYHNIHYQAHALSLMGEYAKKIRHGADWGQVELALWDWEEEFDKLMQMEAMLKANPPPPQPPQPMLDPMTGEEDPRLTEIANQQWQQQVQALQMIEALPKALELRIMQLKTNKVMQTGILDPNDPKSQERAKSIQFILRFDAHMEAHFRLAGGQSTAAASGMQIPAAPGGVESPTGMMPEPSMPMAPPSPGAGAGLGAQTASGSGGPVVEG